MQSGAGSASAEGPPDVADELPCAVGRGVGERGGDAAVLEPPDVVGGMDPLRQDGHEVPHGGGSPGTGADLEDHHGEFLARPVGAVPLPVEDRGELFGGMDAGEILAVPKRNGPAKVLENALQLEAPWDGIATIRFNKVMPASLN